MPLVCIITRIQHLVPSVVYSSHSPVLSVGFFLFALSIHSLLFTPSKPYSSRETGSTLLQANEPNKKSGIRLLMRECIMCELWALYAAALTHFSISLHVSFGCCRIFFFLFLSPSIWIGSLPLHWQHVENTNSDFNARAQLHWQRFGCLNWVIRKALEKIHEMNWRWYL